MPQRKKIRISTIDEACLSAVKEFLDKNPIYNTCDRDTIEIVILEKKAPPRIKNINKAIQNLEQSLTMHKNLLDKGQAFYPLFSSKKDLAKMLNISRPTLDTWIKEGFLGNKEIHFLGRKHFQPYLALEELKKYKKDSQNQNSSKTPQSL